MATVNCEACEELRQNAPEFILNGLTDEMVTSLQNNTGLVPSVGNDDCEDLNNMNDCLIGNMGTEVNSYESCDWKKFMKKFIPNVWTTFKAVISSICGLWCSMEKLVDYLANTLGGQAFVSYYRDLGAGDDVPFWTKVSSGFHPDPLEIYMDSHGSSSGTKEADRDYVVIISNCTNYQGFRELHGYVTYYSSGDTRSISDIREHQAQHPVIFTGEADDTFANFSWTTSGAVLLKKGEHIKVDFRATTVDKGNAEDGDNTRPKVRLHQFVLVWIPVNVSEALDPSDIIGC